MAFKLDPALKNALRLAGISARTKPRKHCTLLTLGRSGFFSAPYNVCYWPAVLRLVREFYPEAYELRSSTNNAHFILGDVWRLLTASRDPNAATLTRGYSLPTYCLPTQKYGQN